MKFYHFLLLNAVLSLLFRVEYGKKPLLKTFIYYSVNLSTQCTYDTYRTAVTERMIHKLAHGLTCPIQSVPFNVPFQQVYRNNAQSLGYSLHSISNDVIV
jgi:hypothetical protein